MSDTVLLSVDSETRVAWFSDAVDAVEDAPVLWADPQMLQKRATSGSSDPHL